MADMEDSTMTTEHGDVDTINFLTFNFTLNYCYKVMFIKIKTFSSNITC